MAVVLAQRFEDVNNHSQKYLYRLAFSAIESGFSMDDSYDEKNDGAYMLIRGDRYAILDTVFDKIDLDFSKLQFSDCVWRLSVPFANKFDYDSRHDLIGKLNLAHYITEVLNDYLQNNLSKLPTWFLNLVQNGHVMAMNAIKLYVERINDGVSEYLSMSSSAIVNRPSYEEVRTMEKSRLVTKGHIYNLCAILFDFALMVDTLKRNYEMDQIQYRAIA